MAVGHDQMAVGHDQITVGHDEKTVGHDQTTVGHDQTTVGHVCLYGLAWSFSDQYNINAFGIFKIGY